MASKSLGTLTLDLVAKTGGYVNGLSKSERETEKWKRKVEANVKSAGKTIGTALAVGAAAAAAGLTYMVRSSLEAIDAQAKMAQRLRTSFDSLSNLARAGELAGVSMQTIEVAARSLDVNLGRASQGFAAQADALAKLKLNAAEVASLPLDQRIQAINTALKQNVSETERAAVAADLFGTRGAAAIQMLDPGTLAEAARQVEIFGLNLSDVDAAKVEQANDAMSTFGLLSEGVANQLTVELAPVLKAMGDAFLESAEEAGGLGTVVQETARDVVSAIAFVVNAADGIGRAFEIAADSAIIAISLLSAKAASNVAMLLDAVSVIPGVDFSQAESDVRAFAATQVGVFREAQASIKENLETPLAGDNLLDFYDEAQKKGQEAAAAAVGARESTEEYSEALGETADQLKKVDVTSKKIELSKDILETIEAQKSYAALVAELRTEEEKLNDTLVERIAILDAVGQRDSETGDRALAAAFTTAPEYAGLAPEIGGAGGELGKINDAQSALEDWYSTQLEMLSSYRAERLITQQQYDEQEQQLTAEHQERIAQIEAARQQASYVATEELFGNLAGLTRQFAGEQSTAYKVLFAAEKAAALARSVVAIQTALAQASASAPFPANLGAMAAVAAQTASIIATISSASISGQAHDGLMSVPKTGTYILEKGERVTTAETSAKLDKTLEETKGHRQTAATPQTNLRVINQFDSDEVVGGYLGSKAGEKAIMNVVSRNRRTIQSF